MFKLATAALLTLAVAATQTAGPERINHEVNARIRAEGRGNSQIMRTMHFLTDVHGPRLTGSPNHKAAAEWTVKQMTEWGFTGGRLEPWDFGRPGWLNERFSGHIVAPVKDALVGEVLAWTPSTAGVVTAEAVQIVPPTRPTQSEMDAWIAAVTPQIKGKIALVGRHERVPVTLEPRPLRTADEDARRQYDPNTPPEERGRGRGRG